MREAFLPFKLLERILFWMILPDEGRVLLLELLRRDLPLDDIDHGWRRVFFSNG